ncbi:Integrator complex subunit 1 [Dermatophagoides farinae]|uniref:Integrator complex subunit 1 n=1 Tax=Dermatophagoides farinae TaxID=6954 RepID=A0A922I177_DERFA|nr:Integrator complex subunit 1 [Dermatophagoides farinae]
MSNKRGNKKHMAPLSQDLFALGATTSAPTSQVKLPAKRNEPFQAPISSMSPKRPKLNSPISQSMIGSSSSLVQPSQQVQPASQQSKLRSWEEKAIIVPTTELKDKILQYDSESDSEEMIERLLCGAVKQLREQKTKPDSCLVFTLLYLAKIRPLFFCSNIIVEAFASLLSREHLFYFKTKNNMVPVLLINLFYHAFHDENSWPELFIRLYVEDSLGDRIWVDNEECKDFVEIIVASFRTKLPPKSLLQTSDVLNITTKHQMESSPNLTLSGSSSIGGEDSVGEESCSSTTSLFCEQNRDIGQQPITSRYLDNEPEIIQYVVEVINENLLRRQTISDVSRNMLKLLIATAGLRNVRLLVAQKLELWFQNPKLTRPAQDLLLTIFLNCDEKDIDTLNHLLKIRLKQKPYISHFCVCFKELLQQKNGTFDIVMRILLTNELNGIRNLNNIQMLSIMFQHNSLDAAKILAKFFISTIFTKEDHLRLLRSLLREIVRSLKSEPINYYCFVSTLIYEFRRVMLDNNIKFDYSREKVINEVVDIITMTIFLSVNQNIRESFARPERKEIMRAFQMNITLVQSETIAWIKEITYNKLGLEDKESLLRILRKLLILEPMDFYCKLDNWPQETERLNIYRITSEGIPLAEESVKNILSMGFHPEVSLSLQDGFELIWTLIHHATMNFDGDMNHPVLLFTDPKIIDLLFSCCEYVCPDNAPLPENYQPPKLARVDLYWKVWFMLVIIAAHLPSTFGKSAWNAFPTFQTLIEMAITNCFQFPPKSMDNDEMQNKILQYNQFEKMKILEFESYLARDQEINESNSYLISSLITLDPCSIPRRPPNPILNDYKLLCTNNTNYRLCHLLCQSREPDFLLIIIDKQQNHISSNSSQFYHSSLNWLIDLVESYESNYGLLPVQCLCEFLLKQVAEEAHVQSANSGADISKLEKAKKKEKRRKLIRLIAYFQDDIVQAANSGKLSNAFEYLIHHLSHPRSTTRMLAYKALYVIASINVGKYLQMLDDNLIPSLFANESVDWFRTNLIKFLKSDLQIQAMCTALNAALSEESNTSLICDYLEFIAEYVKNPDEMLVQKCSSLLIQRKKIAMHIVKYSDHKFKQRFLHSLFKIYWLYLESLMATNKIVRPMEGKKYVYLKFPNIGQRIMIDSGLIHSIILSLSFVDDDFEFSDYYDNLAQHFLDEPYPQIFTDVEMKQPESLIPDWLISRLLSTESTKIVALLFENVKIENIIPYMNSYGISTIVLQTALQAFDKLTAAESKIIKNLNFDRSKLLASFHVFWSKNITAGFKFAKIHLNYKAGSDDTEDVEMNELPKKRDDQKSSQESSFRSETFRKDDVIKMFVDKDFKRLTFLTRQIAAELNDSSVKTKKLTKQFLSEFFNSIEDVTDNIISGTFNSIFNVIIISAVKDSKHFGLNSELTNIKKELSSLDVENIESTMLWKCFDRFLHKDGTKTKKSKLQKKKVSSSSSSSKTWTKALEEFLNKKDQIKAQTSEKWIDIYMDLAYDKFYRKDIDSENFGPHLQTTIFSRNRPYFLSQLLHKSNFSTLNDCIRFILNPDLCLNPTAVLDFLGICIELPKLWIGRENDSQKVQKHEDVLDLNGKQIHCLIDYVLQENAISNRIDLIMRTCCITTYKTEMVIHFLKNFQQESKESIRNELFTRIYLQIPSIGLELKLSDDHVCMLQKLPSFMDKITHNLITSFMYVETNGSTLSISSPQQFIYWGDALLKIASEHPLLFLRQLPMIPAMLRGKVNVVHYDIFKSLNILKIFTKLLNILNLLRPWLWNHNVNGVEQLLNLYMDMFLSYYQLPRQQDSNHELQPLILQFLHLLDDWNKNDSESCSHWIQLHKNDLNELCTAYPNEKNFFESIMSGVPLPNETELIIASQDYRSLEMKLKQSNRLSNEIIATTLSDVNRFVDRYPLLGENFLNSIQSYYSNPYFCELSFTITLKTLQTNPSTVRTIISSFVKCLHNESATVVKNAMVIIPEFVLLAQDYRYTLLRKVFDLAISGDSNATLALIESFRALNSQIGC